MPLLAKSVDLVVVPPRMELYLQFSSMLQEIYGEYTYLVEPYGWDEAWLDDWKYRLKRG